MATINELEIYKADLNPPITARKHFLLTPRNSSFSFSEMYTMMIGGSEKRNHCLNFKIMSGPCVIEKSNILNYFLKISVKL